MAGDLTWSIQVAWGEEFLLLETGDYILLETGDKVIQEDATAYTEEAANAIPPFQLTRGRKNQFSTIQAGKCVFNL